MTEQTCIKTYLAHNGAPVARIIATHTYEDFGEKAGTYCHTNAHTVVTGAGYHLNENYYTDTQTTLQDGPIMAAWNRYSRDEYGNELDKREAAELTQRYARTYWPMVPIVQRRLITGYTQGDEVTVLSWVEPVNSDPTPDEAPYETATRNKTRINNHHDTMEAVARGQFWTVGLETPDLTFTPDDDEKDTYHVGITWHLTDSIGTLAMEEFDPWEELREVAGYYFDIPEHHTSSTDTYEL